MTIKRTAIARKSPEHLIIASWLKETRERSGLTQKSLAESLGYSRSNLARKETGLEGLDTVTLFELYSRGADVGELFRRLTALRYKRSPGRRVKYKAR